jgi:hypothetical protein
MQIRIAGLNWEASDRLLSGQIIVDCIRRTIRVAIIRKQDSPATEIP